jgi:hypothetical protein
MPPIRIPERQPIGDPVTAAVIRVNAAEVLAAVAASDVEVVFQDAMVVRYGVRYLGKPHLSIVPGLIALDYGEMLTGEDAWEFLTRRSNLYPRAEVFGYRNDGRDEIITVKNLDLALPFEVLVYENSTATVPVARPVALIADETEREVFPPRLLEYLPRYPSVAAWLAATRDG